MAFQGRLTKEKFAIGMPVDAPLYQAPPFYYRDATMVAFEYETDPEAAADLLPEPLELLEPATAVLTMAEYPWTTFGIYDEAFLTLLCAHRGRPVMYCTHVFLTTESPLAAGREIWGIPKKLGHIEFARENDQVMVSVERPKGLRICSGLMRPERPLDLGSFEALPMVCLRVIPSPEYGAPPSLAELVEIDVEYRAKELWEGSGSCAYSGASELDPWHKLPVRKMRRCTYGVHDLELRYGKVIEKL